MNNMDEGTNPVAGQGSGLDVFKVADLLVSRAVETHADEIDIIGYYGSYAQGTARATSDLDIFYIPAEGKDPPVGRTVLVQGILFDFWPIRWETMEGFATGRLRGWSLAPAIVHHARVIRSRNEDQAARFAALKQKVLDLQEPAARPVMIRRALEEFRNVLAYVGNLRLAVASGDLTDVRYAGWKVILSVWECLALANQVFFDRGWGHLLEQIPRLNSRPADLEALFVAIGTSPDPAEIADSAERLTLGTRRVLRELQETLTHSRTVQEMFSGSYPEIKDGLGKILSACQKQLPLAASAAAWAAQSDLSLMLNDLRSSSDFSSFNLYSEFGLLYRELGFPDLMRVPSTDLSQLEAQVSLLDDRLRQWLQDQSVELCEFETLEAFERSLASSGA
jgi:hypothetical protein